MNDSQQALQSDLLRLVNRPGSVTEYEELLNILLPPLSWFTSLPPLYAAKYTSQERPQNLGPWWASVQHALLSNILVTWGETLKQEGLYKIVLDGYFTPDNTSADQAWRYTLATCSEQLTAATRAKGTAKLHQLTLSALYQVLENFTQGNIVSRLLNSVKHERNEATRDVEWTEGIAQLIALPTRAANVFELEVPEGLEINAFYSRIAQDWEAALLLGESERLAALLSKLVKTGFVLHRSHNMNFWEAILDKMIGRIQKSHGIPFPEEYTRSWHAVWALMSSHQKALICSLAQQLDVCLSRTNVAWPVSLQETSPGLEGGAFLSATASNARNAAYAVLALVAGSETSSPLELVSWDSPSMTTLYSPLMSLAISAWMPADVLPDLIELWANPSRCVRTSAKQEQMLTTAVLAYTTDTKAALIWKRLGTETMFLQGVSTHLSHHDPLIRRLGMLVAECVSSLTVGEGGKPLQFPSSVWDGQGEGRNICRVLRAMRDSFTFEAVRDAWSDREAWMDALNLNSSDFTQSLSQVRITKPRSQRSKPKASPLSRQIPARIPARPPQGITRPLIEVVESMPDKVEQDHVFHTYADPFEQVISSDEGNESSDDEQKDSTIGAGASNDERENIDKAFTKPKRPPVYIYELAPLAREREIDAQKLLLKHAEPLLRRKTGWGYEISEHASDLCMALCTMQDHYGLKKFEERRLAAMTALCVASPDPVVDCIYEQLFTAHYSAAQRISMLHAVANAAQELAGTQTEDVDEAVERLADDAVSEAHETGSRRTAEADPARHAAQTRQRAVRSAFPSKMIQKLPFAPQGSVRPNVSYTRAALSVFVFPLINRLFSYRRALKRQRIAYAGSETILNDNVLHALLHTLGVLCYYAQNAPHFYTQLVPDVLEMADEILMHYNETMIAGAALSLVLIVLRATMHTSHSVALACSHSALLNRLQDAAQKYFAYSETRAGPNAPTPDYIESPDIRAHRAAAAVVVQLAELQQATQSALLGSMPRP